LPCISTDCKPGGARSLIEDGYNGFIVPIGDKDALAERMLSTILNYSDYAVIGDNARQITKTHTPEVIYEKWNNYLSALVK